MATLLSWNFGHMDSLPLANQRIGNSLDALGLDTASFVSKNGVPEQTLTTWKSLQRRKTPSRRKSNGDVDAPRRLLAVSKSALLQRAEMAKMFISEEQLLRLLKGIIVPAIGTSIAPVQAGATKLLETKARINVTAEKVQVDVSREQPSPPLMASDDIVHKPTLRCQTLEAPHMGWIEVVELQRPEAKNAISWQMLNELGNMVDRLFQDHDTGAHQIRALVILSSLNDAFCTGADLKERKRMNMEETKRFLAQLRTTFARLAALPIPTIACVSGLALGGGLELALCCHFRIFSRNATVALPETRLAIIPGAGGTFRLPKVVGECNALDMILTGRRVQAAEAFRMGLCSRIVNIDESVSADKDRLREATLEAGISLAKVIAAGGPVAIRAALRAVRSASEEAENGAYDAVLATEDRLRALDSFAKKCSPTFGGT